MKLNNVDKCLILTFQRNVWWPIFDNAEIIRYRDHLILVMAIAWDTFPDAMLSFLFRVKQSDRVRHGSYPIRTPF